MKHLNVGDNNMAISSSPEVAPGVITKIIDLSTYIRSFPSTVGFLPIISERGRDNELVRTNSEAFYTEFGDPNIFYAGSNSQGMYVASNFLTASDSLYTIRCLPTDARYANLGITVSRYYTYGEGGTPEVGVVRFGDLTSERVVDAKFKNITSGVDLQGNVIEGYGDEEYQNALTDMTGGLVDGEYLKDLAVIILGLGRGDWYNQFKISIVAHPNPVLRAASIYVLNIYKKMDDVDLVVDNSGETESYTFTDRYELVYSYNVSLDPDYRDLNGEKIFIRDVINNYCPELMCVADVTLCREAAANGADISSPFTGDNAILNLWGGSVGSLFKTIGESGGIFEDEELDDAANVADTLLYQAYSGTLPKAWNIPLGTTSTARVRDVLNTEVYFDLVLDGGYSTTVKDAAEALAADIRKDCIALLDNGDNFSAEDAITSRQEDHNYNTMHCALYEPYTKIFDQYTTSDIWITPIYHVARVVVNSENVGEPWTAPAGFNRGTIDALKDMRYSPSVGEQDLFYINQLNPIVKFNIGDTLYGQLTTQKKPSATQDINIARLILYIKRALENFCKFYIWEENNENTWRDISEQIRVFLVDIQNRRGLYNFDVNVGANEYELKTKQIHVDVTLNPTRIVERINLNFFIQ